MDYRNVDPAHRDLGPPAPSVKGPDWNVGLGGLVGAARMAVTLDW